MKKINKINAYLVRTEEGLTFWTLLKDKGDEVIHELPLIDALGGMDPDSEEVEYLLRELVVMKEKEIINKIEKEFRGEELLYGEWLKIKQSLTK